jgi:hypothetical protein
MAPNDPQDAGNSLEDCARQLDQFVRTANYFPLTINGMTMDEYELLSMSDIDPVDLRMPSRQWELQGLTPLDKALDHVSIYGTDLSNEENT